MKKILTIIVALVAASHFEIFAQSVGTYSEKVALETPDVIFRQIDEHTWEGNGHLMAAESIYLVEGDKRAVLIDAGTRIKDLDKLVAKLTSKPVTLIITHVHPDHTGSAINYFPSLYINAADTVNIPQFMPDYKGEVKYLKDHEVIDLGNRQLTVIFTPGHTPGSTTFIDKEAGYGFSGDSFGSGNLLLTLPFSTLQNTCERMLHCMERHNIQRLYPGHYYGQNAETQQRLKDMITICEDMLSGKRPVEDNPTPNKTLGLDKLVTDFGVRINYNINCLK